MVRSPLYGLHAPKADTRIEAGGGGKYTQIRSLVVRTPHASTLRPSAQHSHSRPPCQPWIPTNSIFFMYMPPKLHLVRHSWSYRQAPRAAQHRCHRSRSLRAFHQRQSSVSRERMGSSLFSLVSPLPGHLSRLRFPIAASPDALQMWVFVADG